MTHAEYVDLMHELAQTLARLSRFDLAPLQAHNDKLLDLGPLDPVAWDKHADTVRAEMRFLETADAAQRYMSGALL